MRSSKIHNISRGEVHQWTLSWLLAARLLPDHGWKCTATVVWNIVLRAAARSVSIFAACRDLVDAPSDQAIFNALSDGLPKTWKVLERRLNDALLDNCSRRLRRRAWHVAIDWHLIPYYGEPKKSRNQLVHSEPKQGTTKFHTYATACITQDGSRYTVALTWVRGHDSMVDVVERLLTQIERKGLKIRLLLLDAAFYKGAVMEALQQRRLAYLMPVSFSGRPPKKRKAKTGLHKIRQQGAGWYKHTFKHRETPVTFSVCVAYRTYKHHKTRKRKQDKLLFAAWGFHRPPTDTRELYRTRFGIESSYRQRRQAAIYTCTRDPHLRLVFVAISLLLRNLWVWIHATHLAERGQPEITLRLDRLRFKRLLDWIAQEIVAILHDGSTPCVILD